MHYKRKEFGKAQFIFPKTTDVLVQKLDIARAMDLFIILGFMFLAFLTFYNYVAVNKIKKSLERKIREEALKEVDHFLDKS